jgi:glyoxylate reductase
MKRKIYVTRAVFEEALTELRREGEVSVSPDDRPLSKAEVKERLRDADGAMTMLTDPIDRDVLSACPSLKIAANVAVGFNNVDVAAATQLGVMTTNTPGVLTDTTADFAWALLMAAARRVVKSSFITPGLCPIPSFANFALRRFLSKNFCGCPIS